MNGAATFLAVGDSPARSHLINVELWLCHMSFWQKWESMDLTDEQWEILEPLIPTPPRREDGRGVGPGEILAMSSTASSGYYFAPWSFLEGAPWKDLPERYPPYQRPATVAFRSGSRKEFLAAYSKP
jgi:hypothetical protein